MGSNEYPSLLSETLRAETPGESRMDIPRIRHVEVGSDGVESLRDDPGMIAAVRSFVERKNTEALDASIETDERVKVFTHKVEEAIEEHYRSLGVLRESEKIAWNPLIEVDVKKYGEGSGSPNRADVVHTQVASKALGNDFGPDDSFARSIDLVERLKFIAHERAHSATYQGDLIVRSRRGEDGVVSLTVGSNRVGAVLTRLGGVTLEKGRDDDMGGERSALEEGAAMTEQKRHEHVIAESFPEEYRIHQEALKRLLMLPDLKHDGATMDITRASQENGGEVYGGWKYPNSFELVSYLNKAVPGFEAAFGKMRLYSNRSLGMSEVRRLVDGHFGQQGVWKDLLLTKEKNADAMLRRLKAMPGGAATS